MPTSPLVKPSLERQNTSKLHVARNNRQDGLSKVEQQIRGIEGQIQMNPLLAEQEFDKSISGKKVRQTGDLNQSIKINARMSLNQSLNLFKQPQLTRLNPSKQGAGR